jgi:hypothetical protein
VEEHREREQYFFDDATVRRLADLLERYRDPCCLCAPMVGDELLRRGVDVTILDIDRRFADRPGFRFFDLQVPRWLGEEFGIILCDPPFFGVSLSRLMKAIRLLARNDYGQPLLLAYLKRRQEKILEVFEPFGLEPTGFLPTYRSVVKLGKFEVEIVSNLPDQDLLALTRTPPPVP